MNKNRWMVVVGTSISLFGTALFVAAQNLPSAPDDIPFEAQDFQLEVAVELVNVTATVLDGDGRYIEELTQEDFKVFEDGVEQQVSFFSHDEQVPISLGILVDTSGSMRHKLQQSLQTAREMAMSLSPADEVFVIEFSNDSEVLTDFTSTGPHIQEVFRGIRTGGETAALDAIGLSLEMMESAQHDKKVLLLITDGFDTRSKLRLADVDELLKRSEVLVYAIGIDDDDEDPEVQRRTRYHVYHYMLARLSDMTGGRAFRLLTGRRYSLRSLAEIMLEELHQQYTLSYYPSNGTGDGRWKEIQVSLDRPDASIRHRTGYYTEGPTISPE